MSMSFYSIMPIGHWQQVSSNCTTFVCHRFLRCGTATTRSAAVKWERRACVSSAAATSACTGARHAKCPLRFAARREVRKSRRPRADSVPPCQRLKTSTSLINIHALCSRQHSRSSTPFTGPVTFSSKFVIIYTNIIVFVVYYYHENPIVIFNVFFPLDASDCQFCF